MEPPHEDLPPVTFSFQSHGDLLSAMEDLERNITEEMKTTKLFAEMFQSKIKEARKRIDAHERLLLQLEVLTKLEKQLEITLEKYSNSIGDKSEHINSFKNIFSTFETLKNVNDSVDESENLENTQGFVELKRMMKLLELRIIDLVSKIEIESSESSLADLESELEKFRSTVSTSLQLEKRELNKGRLIDLISRYHGIKDMVAIYNLGVRFEGEIDDIKFCTDTEKKSVTYSTNCELYEIYNTMKGILIRYMRDYCVKGGEEVIGDSKQEAENFRIQFAQDCRKHSDLTEIGQHLEVIEQEMVQMFIRSATLTVDEDKRLKADITLWEKILHDIQSRTAKLGIKSDDDFDVSEGGESSVFYKFDQMLKSFYKAKDELRIAVGGPSPYGAVGSWKNANLDINDYVVDYKFQKKILALSSVIGNYKHAIDLVEARISKETVDNTLKEIFSLLSTYLRQFDEFSWKKLKSTINLYFAMKFGVGDPMSSGSDEESPGVAYFNKVQNKKDIYVSTIVGCNVELVDIYVYTMWNLDIAMLRESIGNAVFFSVYEHARYYMHLQLKSVSSDHSNLIDMGIGIMNGGLGGVADVALLQLEYVPDQLCPIVADFAPLLPLFPSVCSGVVSKVVNAQLPCYYQSILQGDDLQCSLRQQVLLSIWTLACQEYGTDSDDEYGGHIAEEEEALVWQRS
ncbi:hypothetical protein Dsin_003615 [Dipteronia sinensis]|uniref:Uncharacterized protein n=1 Tax=Dipteronia sinensis TaxID=43782 RepID=A0AAE0B9A2_9ROSI|nr:hypothetical protein Dsin_003615 [Dipteronia sinensis]